MEVVQKNKTEDIGKKIYKKNEYMRKLINLFEHPEYKDFLEHNFQTWENAKVFVMFYKVYEKISADCPDANGYEKLALLKSLIQTSQTRSMICSEINDSIKRIK